MRISKAQFNRAIERYSGVRANRKQRGEVSAPKSKRASTTILTVLVMVIGVATGWVAGIGLNGQSNPPVATSEISSSTTDGAAQLPAQGDQRASQGDQRASHSTSRVAAASHTSPEAEQPPTETDPSAAPETSKGPPKPTKVHDGEVPESSMSSDRAKELRWQALEKMLKDVEIEKKRKDAEMTRRGSANKNQN